MPQHHQKSPTFTKPDDLALYRYLLGTDGESAPAGAAPSPAFMPKRRPAWSGRPTAADIARAEGLDFGPGTLTRRAPRRPDRNRPARSDHRPSTVTAVLELLQQRCPHLSRERAAQAAQEWARCAVGPAEATAWIDRLGWQSRSAGATPACPRRHP